MEPFERIGDQPRWKMLYDAVRPRDYGAIVTYDEIRQIIGKDPRDDRSAIYRCDKELAGDHKILVAVENEGYQIAQPTGHLELMKKRMKKARRASRRATRVNEATDRSMIPPEQAQTMDELQARLSRVEQLTRMNAKRIEVVNEASEKRDDELAHQVSDMQVQISRLAQIVANREKRQRRA